MSAGLDDLGEEVYSAIRDTVREAVSVHLRFEIMHAVQEALNDRRTTLPARLIFDRERVPEAPGEAVKPWE